MSARLSRNDAARQEQPHSPDEDAQGRELSLFRQAIDDSEWTHEALVADGFPVPNAAYISRMLSGEKAWTAKHTAALPTDIKARYHQLGGEREGLIAVPPVDCYETALQQLITGLVGVLAARMLPARASRMAKASWDEKTERRRA